MTTKQTRKASKSAFRIGVDVGGTHTDAVLMLGHTLVGAAKRPTTADVTSGIRDALGEALRQLPRTGRVDAVMVGTTHLTNALLERKRLSPTAVLRLALPATESLPPLVDWPSELRDAVGVHTFMVRGGHEFDGREISPLDAPGIRDALRRMRREGVRAVAVSGVFAPVNPRHEIEAAALIRQEAPELRLSLSHENGRMGLLGERECRRAQCLPGRCRRALGPGHPRCREFPRPRSAALHQPERRHPDGRRVRLPLPGADHFLGPDQQHARRRVPLRRPRRHRGRRGRHLDGCRRTGEGISEGSGGGDGHCRSTHQLPHARHAVDSPRRGQPGGAGTASHRTGEHRLSTEHGCAGVRWHHAHRYGCRSGRRAGPSGRPAPRGEPRRAPGGARDGRDEGPAWKAPSIASRRVRTMFR